MRAIVLTGFGGMDKLVFHDDWPTPTPAAGEVLVKVHACGMNNTDVNTRSGWYSKTVTEGTTGGAYEEIDTDEMTWGGGAVMLPRIQGADMVGTVVAVGAGADERLIGRRVMNDGWIRNWDAPESLEGVGYFGSERDGGFAEYACVHQAQILPVESDLTDAELATFSCSYTTAENLLNRVDCGADDSVLITGASGGVGSALIQLANRRGAKTIALASEEKHDQVAALQPNVILPRSPADLSTALQEATGDSTVSVVADIVGGDYFGQLLNVLQVGGRYCTSGAIAGPIVELDLRTLYLKDLTFFGGTVTSLNVFPDLVSYIERGEIRPILAATWPLEEFHTAQQAFIDKHHTGNIVITME